MMNFYREFFVKEKNRLGQLPTHKLLENFVLCKNEIRRREKKFFQLSFIVVVVVVGDTILIQCQEKKNEREKKRKGRENGIVEKKTFVSEFMQHPLSLVLKLN